MNEIFGKLRSSLRLYNYIILFITYNWNIYFELLYNICIYVGTYYAYYAIYVDIFYLFLFNWLLFQRIIASLSRYTLKYLVVYL